MTRAPRALEVAGDLLWDRVYRHWLHGGGAHALRPDAAMLVLAIQSHADHATGEARLSGPEIAEMIGISARSVARASDHAESLGYIERIDPQPGRKARWRVLRWVTAQAQDGTEIPVSWPYVPRAEGAVREAVEAYLMSGDPARLPPSVTIHVHIAADQVQIVQAGGTGIQVHAPATQGARAATWWASLTDAERATWVARFPTLAPQDDNPRPIGPALMKAAWEAAGMPDVESSP